MSSMSISDPDALKVWAAISLSREKIGLRRDEIVSASRLSENAVECALRGLVTLGLVAYQLLQVGTAGSAEKFYQACDGACLYRS